MNKDAYDKLPTPQRTPLARSEGVVRGLTGHTIGPLPSAEFKRFRKEVAGPIVDEWTVRVPNGAAILAAYRAEVAKVRAEK